MYCVPDFKSSIQSDKCLLHDNPRLTSRHFGKKDLPLLMTASVSAMYTQESLNDLGLSFPFVDSLRARELRVFPPFFGQPRLPHIASLSEQDPLVAPLEELLQEASEREQIRVNLLWMAPPPEELLPSAIDAFLLQIGD